MERPHQARLQGGVYPPSRRDLAGDYTIFANGDELFGYYECEQGIEFAERTQAQSPIVDKWNAYMSDILELEMDPVTGAQPKLEPVFRLD